MLSLPPLGSFESKPLMLKPDDSLFVDLKKEAESPLLESSSLIKSTQPYTSRAYGGHSLSYQEASNMAAVTGNTRTLGLNRNLHEYAVLKIEDEIALAQQKRS